MTWFTVFHPPSAHTDMDNITNLAVGGGLSMGLQEDLRRAVFGKGVAYRPREWRSKEGRIRQARENLYHFLSDWLDGKNPSRRRLSPETFGKPERAGGWPKGLKSEYLRLLRRAWLEFEEIRAEVIAEDPEIMLSLETEVGEEEIEVLNGLGYEERFAKLPL